MACSIMHTTAPCRCPLHALHRSDDRRRNQNHSCYVIEKLIFCFPFCMCISISYILFCLQLFFLLLFDSIQFNAKIHNNNNRTTTKTTPPTYQGRQDRQTGGLAGRQKWIELRFEHSLAWLRPARSDLINELRFERFIESSQSLWKQKTRRQNGKGLESLRKNQKKMLGNSGTVCWLHCGVVLTPSHELVLLLRRVH